MKKKIACFLSLLFLGCFVLSAFAEEFPYPPHVAQKYILPNGVEIPIELLPMTSDNPHMHGFIHMVDLHKVFAALGIDLWSYSIDIGQEDGISHHAKYFNTDARILIDPLPEIIYVHTDAFHWRARETTQQERENMAFLMRYVWREKGDVNIDGKVSSLDALRVLEQVAGVQAEQPLFDLDVNGDGKVSSLDALYILETVSGLR